MSSKLSEDISSWKLLLKKSSSNEDLQELRSSPVIGKNSTISAPDLLMNRIKFQEEELVSPYQQLSQLNFLFEYQYNFGLLSSFNSSSTKVVLVSQEYIVLI